MRGVARQETGDGDAGQQPLCTRLFFRAGKTGAKDQLTPVEPENEPLDRKLMGEVHDLMQEINIVFNEAEKNKYIDKELYYALQLVLKNFRHIEPTHFGISINNYISATAASHCAIHLTGDELAALWKD